MKLPVLLNKFWKKILSPFMKLILLTFEVRINLFCIHYLAYVYLSLCSKPAVIHCFLEGYNQMCKSTHQYHSDWNSREVSMVSWVVFEPMKKLWDIIVQVWTFNNGAISFLLNGWRLNVSTHLNKSLTKRMKKVTPLFDTKIRLNCYFLPIN